MMKDPGIPFEAHQAVGLRHNARTHVSLPAFWITKDKRIARTRFHGIRAGDILYAQEPLSQLTDKYGAVIYKEDYAADHINFQLYEPQGGSGGFSYSTGKTSVRNLFPWEMPRAKSRFVLVVVRVTRFNLAEITDAQRLAEDDRECFGTREQWLKRVYGEKRWPRPSSAEFDAIGVLFTVRPGNIDGVPVRLAHA